jgi:hypothetical protein
MEEKNPHAIQRLHLFNIEISSTIFHLDQLLSTMKENPIFLNIFIEINCFRICFECLPQWTCMESDQFFFKIKDYWYLIYEHVGTRQDKIFIEQARWIFLIVAK